MPQRFVRPPRGYSVSVESLNDALFWLTIEGSPGNHEVQLWISAYGLPKETVAELGARWTGVLQKLFP